MNLFIFLLSAVAFLLISFSIHLFGTKKGSRLMNLLLGISFLARFIQVIVFLLLITSYIFLFPIAQSVYVLLYFASLVSTYLYIRCFIYGESRLKKSDLIHLLPIVFALIHIMPYSFMGNLNWSVIGEQIKVGGQFSIGERMGLFSAKFFNIVQIFFSVVYLLASWYVIFNSNFFSRTRDISKKWMIFFISMSSFFKILSFVVMFYGSVERSYTNSIVILFICCIALLFMMLFVIYQPQILYGYLILTDNYTEPGSKSNQTKKTPSVNTLSDAEHLEGINIMKTFVETQQVFLQQDFQMKDLSKAVDIPAHHCSEIINSVLEKNFRDWINSYRIQYFIEQYPLLKESMTIEAVAFQSGFKNTRTFYNAFKKETGKMPTNFFNNQG